MADISQVKLPNGQTYDLKDALLRNHLGDFEESSDCVPYTLRPTCDGKMDIGDRAYLDKIVGGTVAWNQLLSESNLCPYNTTIKTITPQKVVLTPNGRYSTTLHYGASITSSALGAIPLNHVLFVCVDCASTKADKFRVRIGNTMFWSASVSANTTVRINAIAPFASATLTVYANDDTLYSTSDEITFQNWNIFDLTQMFGTAIADYIYSLETATPGAGVAWFKKLFPVDYYPYNPGELISVSGVSARESVGFNLFDADTVLLPLGFTKDSDGAYFLTNASQIPVGTVIWENKCGYEGQVYFGYEYKFGSSTSAGGRFKVYYSDGSMNYHYPPAATNYTHYSGISNIGKIVKCIEWDYGSGKVSTWFKDICINFSWSDTRNGEYVPYEKHSYPLDSTLTLRGVPKLDAQNNLYYDGDEYAADGTVTRKYNYLEFDGSSDESWILQSINSDGIANFGIQSIPAFANGQYIVNSVCNRFIRQVTLITNTTTEGYLFANNTTLYIRIDSRKANTNTVKAFRTWLASNPTTFVYMLATPTTETADPYLPVIPVDEWGTESFVTSGIVPIGHKTRYVAKLDNLPSLAGGDGYYIIDQTGDKMNLSPITETHIPSLNASKITAGTFGADRIPALDASKISSGSLSADRIPYLGASKITSGTFAIERIPDMNASKITDGTLSADRLPASGITAGSYGPSGNQFPAHGGTFSVPSITADAKGRVTSASTKTVTLPTYSTATSSANGLMSATDKSKLDSMTTVPLASGLNMTDGTDGLIFTYVS